MSSHERSQPARSARNNRLYGYLSLARISNSPTVVGNVLAGAALGGADRWDKVVLTALAMVLFYTAGMFLNDLCDYRFDCSNRPERPLPSGLVTRKEVLAAVLIFFSIGSALLLGMGAAPFSAGLILIALIVAYDLWHKTNPISPLLMAATRAMVYITAALTIAPSLSGLLLLGSGLLAMYIVGLTFIAKHEHQHSFRRFWPALLLLMPAGFVVVQPDLPSLLIAALFVGWVLDCIRRIYRPRAQHGAPIARLIAGMSLFDATVLATIGAWLGSGLALLAFILTLFLQRFVKGT